MYRGMPYARLEALGGIQWPCYDEDRLEPSYLHGRLWASDPAERGAPAPFSVVLHDPPVEALSDEYPLRLTTGRRLDSFNTGVQSGRLVSPLRHGESIDMSPADAAALDVTDGEIVRVSSRRGRVEAPVRLDAGLRPGLVFMTLHFAEEADVNLLTIEADDPRSGTAEFKAAAVRVDKLVPA
jgi:formate dehydrogenase major subunit